jgi:hypothetical protein
VARTSGERSSMARSGYYGPVTHVGTVVSNRCLPTFLDGDQPRRCHPCGGHERFEAARNR